MKQIHIKAILKKEVDVEFFSCAHSIGMIFLLAFLYFIDGKQQISFFIIFEITMLGYFIAWIQKLLFFKERIYKPYEYRIRVLAWNMGPTVLTVMAGRLFEWYKTTTYWVEPVFVVVMFSYYVSVWILLYLLYKEDTQEMNAFLQEFKKPQIVERRES